MAVTNSITGSAGSAPIQPLQRERSRRPSETNNTGGEDRRSTAAAFGSTISQDTTNRRTVKAAREARLATEAARLEANLAEKMQRIKQQQDMQQQKKLRRQSTTRGHGGGRGGVSSDGGGGSGDAGPGCTIGRASIGGAGAAAGDLTVDLAVGSSSAGTSASPRGGGT